MQVISLQSSADNKWELIKPIEEKLCMSLLYLSKLSNDSDFKIPNASFNFGYSFLRQYPISNPITSSSESYQLSVKEAETLYKMICLAENQTYLFIKDFDYQIIKLSSVGDNIVPDIIQDYDHVNNLTLKLKAYKDFQY